MAFLTLLLPALAACTLNPATGEQDFTPFMSPAQESQIGAQEHPKILQQFGGAYDDPALARYVDSIGRLLARTSELPDLRFTFTVLNSPVVNAFALPGGYIYVTRGLLALAGNEAELAGVLAHEIGHVTARHSAQRHSRSTGTQIGLTVLGALGLDGGLGQVLAQGTGLYLRSYSRDQEYEADSLGVRYLTRAGFAPQAMAGFLDKMRAYDELERRLSGQSAPAHSLLSTHPRPTDRVRKAVETARGSQVADPITARDIYLDKINGLIYGDGPDEGVIEGRDFIHPVLRFAFTAPPDFSLTNNPQQVLAAGPDGAKMVFDMGARPQGGDMAAYLTRDWAAKIRLDQVEAITINGMAAATGTAQIRRDGGVWAMRLVAVAFDNRRAARLIFLAPAKGSAEWSEAFRRATYSFRRLTDAEAAAVRPRRLSIVTVRPGDSIESLAPRTAFEDAAAARLRALNGLSEAQTLRPGDKIKLVIQ